MINYIIKKGLLIITYDELITICHHDLLHKLNDPLRIKKGFLIIVHHNHNIQIMLCN
jgi:hypothetical protein